MIHSAGGDELAGPQQLHLVDRHPEFEPREAHEIARRGQDAAVQRPAEYWQVALASHPRLVRGATDLIGSGYGEVYKRDLLVDRVELFPKQIMPVP